MIHGVVIYPGKPDESFIASLHTIRNVKWQAFITTGEVGHVDTFDKLHPGNGKLVVILDPASTTFGYLSGLVRNGCHLFLTENQLMTNEDRVKLNQLAEEGNTLIQIRHDLLFHPSLAAAAKKSHEIKLIEIHHFEPNEPDRLQEMLYSNLMMILKIAGSEPSRLNVCSISNSGNQLGVVNLHLNFHNGSAASLTLSFNGEKKEHLLSLHSGKGSTNYNFKETGAFPGQFGNNQLTRQIAGFSESILKKNHQRFYLSEVARTFQLIEKINRKLAFNVQLV
jgi:predicted dehydrogenase